LQSLESGFENQLIKNRETEEMTRKSHRFLFSHREDGLENALKNAQAVERGAVTLTGLPENVTIKALNSIRNVSWEWNQNP